MLPSFVILTAAKNEEDYLPKAIEAVVRQTVRPARWVIIDDGSTDDTAGVVRRAMLDHPFIELYSTHSGTARSFGSKDRAINAGYAELRGMRFDCVAFLDADIAPARTDIFEHMLRAFAEDERLGIIGAYVHELQPDGRWRSRRSNTPDSAAGGLQMFRVRCYEQIGGYTPLELGGEDWLAQIDARQAGWTVQVLVDQPLLHYRPTSTAGGRWRGLFRLGLMDASFGSHPLFEGLKCVRRFVQHPLILGGLARFAGYVWWHASRRRPLLPSDKIRFLRQEQKDKIRAAIRGIVS